MASVTPLASELGIIRFGDFEADFRRHELRKHGMRVRIQGKPLAVLALLVENPGEIVSRDELRKRLWPDDVFVDFDKNLATAVNKLRSALCDTAAKPRYIETVPRLGYRFIATIEASPEIHGNGFPELKAVPGAVPAPSPQPNAETISTDGELDSASLAGIDPSAHSASAQPAVAPAKTRTSRLLVAAAILLAGIVILPSELVSGRRHTLMNSGPVIVGDIANNTGDHVFNGTLRQGLIAQLEQSHLLHLASDTQIGQALERMEHPRDTYLSSTVTREICARTGGVAAVAGSISALGSQYQIVLRAEGCRDGELLGQVEAAAGSRERVLGALGDAARRLRIELGESLQSVKSSDLPPEDVTTASLEALQAYSIGYRVLLVDNNSHAAIPFFKQALDRDPNFAMAWARLGRCYDSEEEEGLAAEAFTKAHELRQHASQREQLYIDAYYEYLVTGDLEGAARVFRIWAETYPGDYTPHASLGNIYSALGLFDQALVERRTALRLDPGVGLNYGNLVSSLVGLRRFDEARSVSQEAQAHKLDSPEIHLVMSWVAWIEGKPDEHAALLAPVLHDPLVEQWAEEDEALIAASEGRFADARNLERSALDGYRRIDRMQAGWAHVARAGIREAMVGNFTLAREDASTALSNDNSRDVRGDAAIALALAGDASQAEQIAQQLAAQFPQSTVVQRHFLPAIRGAIALRSGRPADALAALAPAEPYNLGIVGDVAIAAYLRGEALLALKDGSHAAEAFNKLIDGCPYPGTFPCSVARLQLARAYSMAGQSGKASAAYQQFFSLWKDSDRDIPILHPARLEFGRLPRG